MSVEKDKACHVNDRLRKFVCVKKQTVIDKLSESHDNVKSRSDVERTMDIFFASMMSMRGGKR